MSAHSLYYYPYGAFGEPQRTLLKCAALYFDKLYVLDPDRASVGLGARPLDKELRMLEAEGILNRIAPADVLGRYEDGITRAIFADVRYYGAALVWRCARSGRTQTAGSCA